MTPGERWVQRVMGGLGVRPVGHADPRDDEGDTMAPAAPVVPVQPSAPAPDWPPAGARRISTTAGPGSLPAPGRTLPPDWVVAAFEADARKEAERKAAEEAAKAADDEDQDDEDQEDEEAPAPAAPPAPTGPVAKVPAGAKPVRKKQPGKGGKSLKDDPSLRITVFNLTAAAVGYGTPLAGIIDTYLTFAEQAARGVFAFLLAAGGAVGTWWVTGRPAVREVLACLPYWGVIRLAACLGIAEIGRRVAPLPVAWLNETGTEWGLGPNAVSLLITSGGICFALWWFIDRKLRRFHWVVRWLPRVPLATAVVVSLNYGNPL
ncbi:hypothetical protein [Streptomyces variegatus]|uniref:hypothetical protein n=1 Tax=Streptomyces variegatus TaxID=284040 RepID=UPI003C2DE9B4